MNKLLLTLLVSVLCVLPAAAQKGTPRPQTTQALETQVERAVTQAETKQHQSNCPCATKTNLTEEEPLSIEELIAAEEELSVIRNRDTHASFEKYPYLLDPAYRRRNDSVQTKSCSPCSCKAKKLRSDYHCRIKRIGTLMSFKTQMRIVFFGRRRGKQDNFGTVMQLILGSISSFLPMP